MLVRSSCVACTGVSAALQIDSLSAHAVMRVASATNLLTHNFDVLLCLLYHLHSSVPLFLELHLRLLNVFLLKPCPLLKLFLLLTIRARWKLAGFEHLLDVFALLLLTVVQSFLSHGDQVQEFIVRNEVLEFGCGVFLEGVTLKEGMMRGLWHTWLGLELKLLQHQILILLLYIVLHWVCINLIALKQRLLRTMRSQVSFRPTASISPTCLIPFIHSESRAFLFFRRAELEL